MKYTLKPIDKKFLKAVDYIIAKHKSLILEPSNDNAISICVFDKRGVISKIRASSRGVTQKQIELFANYFSLDFNFFYKPEVLHPEPSVMQWGKRGYFERESSFTLHGDNSGHINNGPIYVYLDKVKELTQTALSKVPKDHLIALEAIRSECHLLEARLKNATEQLGNMEERFNQTVLQLTTQLSEVQKRENQYLRELLQLSNGNGARVTLPNVVGGNGQSG